MEQLKKLSTIVDQKVINERCHQLSAIMERIVSHDRFPAAQCRDGAEGYYRSSDQHSAMVEQKVTKERFQWLRAAVEHKATSSTSISALLWSRS